MEQASTAAQGPAPALALIVLPTAPQPVLESIQDKTKDPINQSKSSSNTAATVEHNQRNLSLNLNQTHRNTMIDATKNELSNLVERANKVVYLETGESSFSDDSNSEPQRYSFFRQPMLVCCFALLVGFFAGSVRKNHTAKENSNCIKSLPKGLTQGLTCKFCDQSPPTLHHDQSYSILLPSNSSTKNDNTAQLKSVVVTPMTVAYDYELYDGEMIFTIPPLELVPNVEFDYAVLGVGSIRNLHRDSGQPVSLDEVYLHHFTLKPTSMLGAEVLNRKMDDDPYMLFPDGYALHILADEMPYLEVNAHLLSHKNLAPIQGSLELAHKECNECYYAPTKGSNCTPDVSGTFSCCGDSIVCMVGEEDCACATTTTKSTTTKYRIELDLLISKDVESFERIDQWNFAAPSCSVNFVGETIFEDYPADSFCSRLSPPNKHHNQTLSMSFFYGGGALFHHVPELSIEQPYYKTTSSVVAPASGMMVWGQGHFHTGGVNVTFYQNGKIICTNTGEYGTNPDPSTNARNELNHLIYISSCYDQISSSSTGGIRFEKGDVFTTESYYYGGIDDSRFSSPLSAGEHKNVMSMFFTGIVFDRTSTFIAKSRTSLELWNDFVQVAGI